MSIVQISKIQVRRGQKLTGNGVPQLSSGEIAWAIDTQELYIGNGSLSEGAPAVGNTKILTEQDNILRLANSYRFGDGNLSIASSKIRSLQSKLDEIQVSVIDFGADPDGSTDCTLAFHNAFDDLIINATDNKLKKVVVVPCGIYIFTADLKIPSGIILRGENKHETVLEISNNDIILTSRNETMPGFFSASDLPNFIEISNLTIVHQQGQTIITSSQHCKFESVIWRSEYLLGDPVLVSENAYLIYNIPIVSNGGNITVSGTGVSSTIVRTFASTYVETLTNLVADLNNDTGTFANLFQAFVEGNTLKIRSLNSAVLANEIAVQFNVTSLASSAFGQISIPVTPILFAYSDGSQAVNASVYWENDLFGRRTTENHFIHCVWDSSKLAIKVNQTDSFDTYNFFDNCQFKFCGMGIYVAGVTDQGNRWRFDNCVFDKIASQALNITNGIGTHLNSCEFLSVGTGDSTSQYPLTTAVKFGQLADNVLINCASDRLRLHSLTNIVSTEAIAEFQNASVHLVDKNYSVIYLSDSPRTFAVFSSANKIIKLDYVLQLSTHYRTGQVIMTVDQWNNSVSLSDNFTFSSGGSTMTLFKFDATLVSNSAQDDSTSVESETIILSYTNPTGTGALGSIVFSASYGV